MLEYLILITGLIVLVVGAHYLVKGSSSLARRLNIPALVIGLTVVAFGTSMPELLINLWASGIGSSEIALGNIVGSNLINILLILGMTSLIYSIRVKSLQFGKRFHFLYWLLLCC